MQPDAGSQPSVPLQTLPSLQASGVPGWQVPLPRLQVSAPVQTLLSVQSDAASQVHVGGGPTASGGSCPGADAAAQPPSAA